MTERKKPVVDTDVCVSCGVCSQACPQGCIDMNLKTTDSFLNPYPCIDEAACIGCSLCSKACPVGAMTMR